VRVFSLTHLEPFMAWLNRGEATAARGPIS